MTKGINHCGIVVLAGGQSSRLGSPKQLLSYAGSTLLRQTVDVALDADCGPVIVVTGANSIEVKQALTGLKIQVVENPGWQEGMASSLRVGLQEMLVTHPETDGIIFMVCDQPYVNKSVLLCLLEAQQTTGKAVAASSYQGKAGTPALFHRSFFKKLIELKGDKGARMLIEAHYDEVAEVPFEKGSIDIDTKEDYEHLINGLNNTP